MGQNKASNDKEGDTNDHLVDKMFDETRDRVLAEK